MAPHQLSLSCAPAPEKRRSREPVKGQQPITGVLRWEREDCIQMGIIRERHRYKDALQWTGNYYELNEFCGHSWDLSRNHKKIDTVLELLVWNSTVMLWIPCPVGYWIIRNPDGSFFVSKRKGKVK